MSASRIGRGALKKAQIPTPGPSRTNPIQAGQTSPHAPPSLPKRANPHLLNLRPEPESPPRMSPRAMTVLGVGVLAMSTYCGYLYASYRREVRQSQALEVPVDVSDRYNHTASSFDADVEMSEKLMRMGAKRRELVQGARGNVLEVSCGTGRNLEYYDLGGERRGVDEQGRAERKGCRSVTFVDLSPQMVEITREKFARLYPQFGRVVFRVQDAREVPPPDTVTGTATATATSRPTTNDANGEQAARYYDTIVQTMGLCSMPDPVATLRHLGTITEPQRGRILLLEHGRSHYEWLNRILDNLAPAHADRHGCWWNRDIGQIVRESGLEVVDVQRWHFGTTWRYVLRPV